MSGNQELVPRSTSTPSDPDQRVRIRLRGGGGDPNSDAMSMAVEVSKSTSMCQIKQSYCNRFGVSKNNLRFLFDGERLNDEITLSQLELQENCILQNDDEIEIFPYSDGGY